MLQVKEFNIIGKVKCDKCYLYFVSSVEPLKRGEGKQAGKIFAPLSEDYELGEIVECIEVQGKLELLTSN